MGGLQGLFSAVVGHAALLVLVVGGALLFTGLVRAERAGRPQRAVGILLFLLVLELFLYPSQNGVPGLPFRLSVFGQSFRLLEVFILVAMAARLYVRKFPPRSSVAGLLWGVFLLWWSAAFVVGLLHDNASDLALFHFNMVIYVGGSMVLAGGVPVARYVDRRSVGRWALGLGVAVLVSIGPTLTETPLAVDPALAPGALVGLISADLATVLVGVAVVVLLLENARPIRRRLLVGLTAVLFLGTPFFQGQRAAFLGLAAAVGLLVVVSSTSVWRRRVATTYTEAALFVALALVPFLGNMVWTAMDPGRTPEAATASGAVVDSVEQSFNSTGKQQSAATRQNLWRDGLDRFAERPFVGSGLGTEYSVERAGSDEPLVGGGFHNVVVDVLVRTGVVGLVLLVAALWATVGAGVRVWRRHTDPRVAALALGALVALANVLAKAMVESVFEKYRLAVFTGLLLGVLLSAAASLPRRGGIEAPAAEAPEPGRPAVPA